MISSSGTQPASGKVYVIGRVSPATRSSFALHARAALPNSRLRLLRAEGSHTSAAAPRHDNSSPRATLRFIAVSCIGR